MSELFEFDGATKNASHFPSNKLFHNLYTIGNDLNLIENKKLLHQTLRDNACAVSQVTDAQKSDGNLRFPADTKNAKHFSESLIFGTTQGGLGLVLENEDCFGGGGFESGQVTDLRNGLGDEFEKFFWGFLSVSKPKTSVFDEKEVGYEV